MHYASIENISKSFGIRTLFKNISFYVEEGDKIAFVARNGSGKTTLLKIIAGLDTADTGTTWVHKDIKVIIVERTPLEELKIYYNFKDFFKKKIIKFLIFLFYRFSDKIIANSHGIKQSLERISNAKVEVIYPPSIKKIVDLIKRKKIWY